MTAGSASRLSALPRDDAAPDLEVVGRVLAGQTIDFALLVRRHNQRLYRAVRAILRADDEAEDVVQQTYVAAFHKLAQFRGEASLASWLTRIAVNEAIGRQRARARHGDFALIEAAQEAEMADGGRSPEDELAAREMGAILEQHVDALPESLRVVFMLRDVQELDTAETAASLEISEEAVRVRLHRARHSLQESLTRSMGAATVEAFRFDGARCDRIVLGVLDALGL